MGVMGVAKDAPEKMSGEDLKHAYDAVRVANKSVATATVNLSVCSHIS